MQIRWLHPSRICQLTQAYPNDRPNFWNNPLLHEGLYLLSHTAHEFPLSYFCSLHLGYSHCLFTTLLVQGSMYPRCFVCMFYIFKRRKKTQKDMKTNQLFLMKAVHSQVPPIFHSLMAICTIEIQCPSNYRKDACHWL